MHFFSQASDGLEKEVHSSEGFVKYSCSICLDFSTICHSSQAVNSSIAQSRDRLFASYCDIKIEPLAGVIENKMYEGEFTWEDCSPVKGEKPCCLNRLEMDRLEIFVIRKRIFVKFLFD